MVGGREGERRRMTLLIRDNDCHMSRRQQAPQDSQGKGRVAGVLKNKQDSGQYRGDQVVFQGCRRFWITPRRCKRMMRHRPFRGTQKINNELKTGQVPEKKFPGGRPSQAPAAVRVLLGSERDRLEGGGRGKGGEQIITEGHPGSR